MSNAPIIVHVDTSSGAITAIATSGSDAYYVCGKDDGSVIIYDAINGTPIRKVYTHSVTASVMRLQWSSSGMYIVSSDESARIIVKRLEVKAEGQWRVYPVIDVLVVELVHQFLFNEDEQRLVISTSSTDQIHDLWTKTQEWKRDWGTRRYGSWVQSPLGPASLLWLEHHMLTAYSWSAMSIQITAAINPGQGPGFGDALEI